MAWTYILRCNDGSFYTGSTNRDLDARVWEHNNDDLSGANFTRRRRPAVLVYAEQFLTIDAAFFREKQVQGWSRRKKLALIEGRGAELPALSTASAERTLRQAQRPGAGLSDPVTGPSGPGRSAGQGA